MKTELGNAIETTVNATTQSKSFSTTSLPSIIHGDPKKFVTIFYLIKNPFLTNVFSVVGCER
jgi:hypothetical protein